MDRIRHWFRKLLSLLRVRATVAGLEITDELIRLAYFDGILWQMHAIRVSPGTMESGAIKDRDAFLGALRELRIKSGILDHDTAKRSGAVVALGSANTYSTVFHLPAIEGEELKKAIELNLQMASPGNLTEMYSGSEIVGREAGSGQLDVLASFIDCTLVDDMVDALFSAGFVAMAVESKAIALTRVFREKGSGIDIVKPYVFVSVDNAGLEFFIVRNGAPYFEYVNHWRDIAGDKGEVPLQALKDDLTVSLRQVLNFYAQHWMEPLAAIILANPALPDDIEKNIAANFALPVVRLTLLMGQAISSEWLVALGASMRKIGFESSNGAEANFLNEELKDRFRVEQAVGFLEFWRVAFPMALGVLVLAFFVTNLFFGQTQAAIEAGPQFVSTLSSSSSLTALEASAAAFNDLVAMVSGLENASTSPPSAVIGTVDSIAASSSITVSRLTVQDGRQAAGVPISLSALSASEDNVSAFKTALMTNPHIGSINLPLTGIQTNGTGYSFSVTFIYH